MGTGRTGDAALVVISHPGQMDTNSAGWLHHVKSSQDEAYRHLVIIEKAAEDRSAANAGRNQSRHCDQEDSAVLVSLISPVKTA